MPSGASLFTSEAARSPPVDLEMLSESLIFQSVELVFEFKGYAVGAAKRILSRYHQNEDVEEALLCAGSRLWRWLQQRLRLEQEITDKQLLLPQPAVFPLRMQHTDYITERFDDVKTQLQLIHAAVDDLQTRGDQTDTKLSRLHEQLRRTPICRCEASIPSPQSFKEKVSSHITKVSEKRSASDRSGAALLRLDRMEVPVGLAHPPTTLREESSAILYWIIKAVDSGTPKLNSGHRASQPREQASAEHEQLESEDNMNTTQEPAMHIAQMYQILVHDD
ncbi:hypothetical protein L915_03098 [Phytophthora nicotianae]|uniref:Uncharacterized protein n=2 Tax=Phytophthora nicotianae TaxID=4792 RepID=W2QPF9_PHYN3|nr:hypothetical protein PPTG_07804 [Phytophthora nicotianae INRA-310]ETK93760.1 hypothetical protein L915_03098 [Phytophthora nicotianae]ETL47155.1 hypothetical protein L916_03069 [Phytophthora nicotianae]ETN14145.1 hypothetical protein PPTG_07804 [Phytophthora nicotianae INRA-310]